MADKAHASPASRNSIEPVTALNSNDVLLGRGAGSSQYIGNQKFRDLVEERKEEYSSSASRMPKAKIAEEILDHVQSLGGRFLQLDENQGAIDNMVEEGIWHVVDDKAALEKCKQALRQKRMPSAAARRNEDTVSVLPAPASAAIPVGKSSCNSVSLVGDIPVSDAGSSTLTSNALPFLPSTLFASAALGTIDARLLLFHTDPRGANPYFQLNQALLGQRYIPSTSRIAEAQPNLSFWGNRAATVSQEQQCAQRSDLSSIESHKTASGIVLQGSNNGRDETSGNVMATGQESSNHGEGIASGAATTTEDDVSEFLLSILALSGRTRFTERQDAQEKASMTNEERAKVLSDLFGKYCSTSHQSKKARRDLDKDSIAFLVKQTWVEIEKVPARNKQALIEAQQVCRAEEFSDARLERFLRCVGMNVQVRATGVIFYHWAC